MSPAQMVLGLQYELFKMPDSQWDHVWGRCSLEKDGSGQLDLSHVRARH